MMSPPAPHSLGLWVRTLSVLALLVLGHLIEATPARSDLAPTQRVDIAAAEAQTPDLWIADQLQTLCAPKPSTAKADPDPDQLPLPAPRPGVSCQGDVGFTPRAPPRAPQSAVKANPPRAPPLRLI